MAADLLKLRGQIIKGRYRVEEQLGAGGMGVVYRATQLHLLQPCALKFITPQPNPHLAQVMRRRFRREAQLGFRVRHEGLVTVFDFDQLGENTPFYAMELLGGRSLRDLIGAVGRLSWQAAVEVGLQAAAALEALHQAQVIHRDLKPDNMQLLDSGRVKVLDLGVIHAEDGICADENDITDIRTHTGERLGTPEYMAPEQLRDSKRVDASTDVYGLCLVIYEIMSGHQPFRGRGFEEIVEMKFSEHPVPPLRLFTKEAPPALEALLHAGTATERRLRPQTMTELVAGLEPLLGGMRAGLRASLSELARRVPATPPPIWEARAMASARHEVGVRAPTEPLPEGPQGVPEGPQGVKGRRRLVCALAGGVSLLLASGIALPRLRGTQTTRQATAQAPVPAERQAAVERPRALDQPRGSAPAPERGQPSARGEAARARLRVAVIPSAEVYIDGQLRREGTPFTYSVAPGRHRVRLINHSLGRDETRHMQLAAGTTTLLSLDWSAR